MEEYGAEILNIKYIGTRNVLRTNKSGKRTHWVANGFAVRVNPEQVKIGEPHKMDEIGWFSLSEFPDPLHSQIPGHVEHFGLGEALN